MRLGITIFLLMMYIIGAMYSGIMENEYLGADEVGTINGIMRVTELDYSNPIAAVTSVPSALWIILVWFFNVLTWNFAFLQAEMIALRLLLCCISAGVIISWLSNFFGRSG